LACAVLVLLNRGTAKLQSGKSAPRAGIAKYLGPQLPVSVCCGVAAYRPCRYTGIGAQLEFAGEQVSHAILIHDQHNQVHCLSADLQPNTAALHGKECRRAPAFGRAAAGHSAAIAGAYNEASLEHGRNYSQDRKSTRLNSSHVA